MISRRFLANLILVSGIVLFALSWIMEINFHYIQNFKTDNTPEDIFWRAEQSIYPVSTFLLVYGIILIIIGAIALRQEVKMYSKGKQKPQRKRGK